MLFKTLVPGEIAFRHQHVRLAFSAERSRSHSVEKLCTHKNSTPCRSPPSPVVDTPLPRSKLLGNHSPSAPKATCPGIAGQDAAKPRNLLDRKERRSSAKIFETRDAASADARRVSPGRCPGVPWTCMKMKRESRGAAFGEALHAEAGRLQR